MACIFMGGIASVGLVGAQFFLEEFLGVFLRFGGGVYGLISAVEFEAANSQCEGSDVEWIWDVLGLERLALWPASGGVSDRSHDESS